MTKCKLYKAEADAFNEKLVPIKKEDVDFSKLQFTSHLEDNDKFKQYIADTYHQLTEETDVYRFSVKPTSEEDHKPQSYMPQERRQNVPPTIPLGERAMEDRVSDDTLSFFVTKEAAMGKAKAILTGAHGDPDEEAVRLNNLGDHILREHVKPGMLLMSKASVSSGHLEGLPLDTYNWEETCANGEYTPIKQYGDESNE